MKFLPSNYPFISNKSPLSRRFGTILFFSLFLIITSCKPTQNIVSTDEEEQGWKLVKAEKNDHPTWMIHAREITGTSFLEYKIEGQVAAEPTNCATAVKRDIHDHASGSKAKKFPTYDIVQETEESLATYVIHNEPFPLKDTEMSVRYTFLKHQDGSTEITWKEAWDENPAEPSRKLSRVETFRGSWAFLPLSEQSSRAVRTVQFDPQKMPMWLAEPMVIKFLKDGLEDMQTLTAE